MASHLLESIDSVPPNFHDIEIAKSSRAVLANFLDEKQDFRIQLVQDHGEVTEITIPIDALRRLLSVLSAMADGNAVTVLPIESELTTQEAADLLNVSRPYVVNLLESRAIPFHMVGSHRRILTADLVSFKRRLDAKRRNALQTLSDEAQDLGLDY